MRKLAITLGLAELAAAAVLGYVGWSVPDVTGSLATTHAATVASLEKTQETMRRVERLQSPEHQELLASLETQNHRVRAALAAEELDGSHVEQLRVSLCAVGEGLKALSDMLDEAPVRKLGKGLSEAADYLDQQVVAAEAAAKRLEETGDLMRADSLRLAELLRVAPLDLEAMQEIHDALSKFAKGAEALCQVMEMPRLPAIRQGLQGLETSLESSAHQVEQLSGYTYPVFYWEGVRPRSYQKPFWPAGTTIAQGMTEAAQGVKAADQQLVAITDQLPKMREAIQGSQQVLQRGQDSLALVLKHRNLVESLVKSLPETAARLAEDLPLLAKDLAATLRETRRLKEIAAGLRGTQQQIDKAVAAWPAARTALLRAADGLELQCGHMEKVLAAKNATSLANGSVMRASTSMDKVLPQWEGNVQAWLREDEAALATATAQLELGLAQQRQAMPQMEQHKNYLRWGLWVLACVLGLQGLHQIWPRGRTT